MVAFYPELALLNWMYIIALLAAGAGANAFLRFRR